jgi:hypothetical protein
MYIDLKYEGNPSFDYQYTLSKINERGKYQWKGGGSKERGNEEVYGGYILKIEK